MKAAAELLALLVLAAFPAHADSSAATNYQRGNQLFQAGDHQAARDAYRQAALEGGADAYLFYNLGVAELKCGDLGRAIANFHRAERLAPRDDDVRFNLALARQMVKIKPPEGAETFLHIVLGASSRWLSANEWTLALLLCYWIAAIAAAVLIGADFSRLRPAVKAVALIAGALLILMLPFAAYRVKSDYFTVRAVIVTKDGVARSGPGEENDEQFKLADGMEVEVKECVSGWCKIQAEGGFIGWTQAENFDRL